MLSKVSMLSFLFIVLIISLVSAQSQQTSLMDNFNLSTDLINTIIVPSIVIFFLLFGLVSIVRIFPKIISGLIAFVITLAFLYFGVIKLLVNVLFYLGGFVATLVFIVLFIFGIFLISRTKGYYRQYYYIARKMKRKQIASHLSYLESRIVKIEGELTRLKIQENNLRIKFIVEKSEKASKELEKLRGQITRLANLRDKLLEEKEMYTKAYREATM